MKKLSDNIIMSNAYCEITECGDIENCEKCVELNILEHDKQIRADERNNVLSTLSKLIESDYNSKECKLLLADLCEMLLEQLKEQNGKNNNQS